MSSDRPTRRAPHIRATVDLSRIQGVQLLALIPVSIVAVINTGYQYLLALNSLQGQSFWDRTDAAIYFLGLDYADPSLLTAFVAGLVHFVPILAVAVLSAGVCERACYTLRNVPMQKGYLVSGLVFALLMPPAASVLHVMFAMVFAMVFGKCVFGGDGKTFVNPVLLAAAVAQISFPAALTDHPLWTGVAGYSGSSIFSGYHYQGEAAFAAAGVDWWSAMVGTTQGMMGTTSVVAIILGAGLLLWSRIASWRLIAGQVLGLVLIAMVCNMLGGGILDMPWYWHLVLGNFAFCTVFVATDPASSAATDIGRWVQGLLMGALVVIIRVVNESHPDGVVSALLIGSVLAPLIDHVVVWFNVRQRSRRPV